MITGPEEKGYLPVMGLDDDGMILNGFIPKAQIQPDSEPCNENWTDWAEKFIGAPYKWGGRSAWP